MNRFDYFVLPENEGLYKIPEVAKAILTHFEFKNRNDVKQNRNIKQNLWRALENEPCNNDEGKRKTAYARATIEDVVNNKLYKIFVEMANMSKSKEYEELEKLAAEYEKSYWKFSESVEYENYFKSLSNQNEEFDNQNQINKQIADFRFKCLFSVFCRLFKFDETSARVDIETKFFCNESNPNSKDISAINQLENFSNYYEESVFNKLEKLLSYDIKDFDKLDRLLAYDTKALDKLDRLLSANKMTIT